MLCILSSNITVEPTYRATKYVERALFLSNMISLFKFIMAVILTIVFFGGSFLAIEHLYNKNLISREVFDYMVYFVIAIIIIAWIMIAINYFTTENRFATKNLTAFSASLPKGWVMQDDIVRCRSSGITRLTIHNIERNSRVYIEDNNDAADMINQLKTPNSDLWKLILSTIAIVEKTEYTIGCICIARGYCVYFSRQATFVSVDVNRLPISDKKPTESNLEYRIRVEQEKLQYVQMKLMFLGIPPYLKPGAQKRARDLPIFIYSSNAMEMIYTLNNKLLDLHSISNALIEQQPMQLILRLLVGQSNNKYIYTLKLHVPSFNMNNSNLLDLIHNMEQEWTIVFNVNHSNLSDQMYKIEQEWAQSSNSVASLNLDDWQVSQTWLNSNMQSLLKNLQGK